MGVKITLCTWRDGLLPKLMTKLSPKYQTPTINTWIFAFAVSFCAGFIPLDRLAELVNMGTLIAFTIVSLGVVYLRKIKTSLQAVLKYPSSQYCRFFHLSHVYF